MFHIIGNILWLRTVTLTFPVCELSSLDWIKKCFLPVVPLLCGIFKETLQICFTSKVTYCDKEPSLLPFQFMSYLPLIDLKNGFWPVVHLLYGISEWNFTDMLTIKGYILWVRIVTLTFPDCELSTLDWSENWFLTCSSFHPSVLMTIKGYILWVRIVTLTFPNCELSTLDWSENWFLTCSSFHPSVLTVSDR